MATATDSGIKSISKMKPIVSEINGSLIDLSNHLGDLSSDLKKMMQGDSEGPFWNGEEAVQFYDRAIKNLKNDWADYNSAYNKAQNLAVACETTKSK